MPMLALACGFEPGTAVGTVDTTANIQKPPAGARYTDAAVAGLPTVITGGRLGGYMMRLSSVNTAQNIAWDTSTLGTSKTSLVVSGWFRFNAALPTASTRIGQLESVTDDAVFRYNAGNIELPIGAGTNRVGPAVVADRWYHFEAHFNVVANPLTCDWKIDGVAQTQATSAVAATTINFFTLGWSTTAQTATIDYDDWVASVTLADYPLGPHKVVLLTVDPAGTLTVNTSTSNFDTFADATPTHTAWNATTARDAVIERPPDVGVAAQDGFSQIATATTDFVNCPMTTYALGQDESISGGRMVAATHADTTLAATLGFRYITTGSEVTLKAATDWNQDNTTVPAWVCHMLTVADIDTQAELDALVMRVGYSGDASPKIGIHAIYVELAVKESPFFFFPRLVMQPKVAY